jgi:hypothetical protein
VQPEARRGHSDDARRAAQPSRRPCACDGRRRCASPGDPARLEVGPVRRSPPGEVHVPRRRLIPKDARSTLASAGRSPSGRKGHVMPGGRWPSPTMRRRHYPTQRLFRQPIGPRLSRSHRPRGSAFFRGIIPDAGEGDEPRRSSRAAGSVPAPRSRRRRAGPQDDLRRDHRRARARPAALGFVLRRGAWARRPSSRRADDGERLGAERRARGLPARRRRVAGPARPRSAVLCPSCRTNSAGHLLPARRQPARCGPRPMQGPRRQLEACVPHAGAATTRHQTCPVHGDDLVPAAVYRATVQRWARRPKGQDMPELWGRYGGQATFCGKDGTALVLVN